MRWTRCNVAAPNAESNAPSARMGHIAVAVDAKESWGDDILVVHGGLSEGKYALGDVCVFQTEGNTWSRPQMPAEGPQSRAFHCAAAVSTKVFLFGGHLWVKEKKGLQKFNDLWCLNTDNWEWNHIELQKDAAQPSPRDFACMVALEGGRLLVHGGLDATERRLDDTWMFDTVTSVWTELKVNGMRPKPRYGHCMCRVESRVLMFGGENNTSLANDLWTLRGLGLDGEEAPAWIPLELPGNAPPARKGHSCTCVGLWLVVMGGRTADVGWFRTKTDTFLNDVFVMDREGPVQWRSPAVNGDAPAPREFHTVTALTKGRLILFGGGNGKQIFGDCWWLDTEGEASVNSTLSDQSIQAYLASTGRPGGSRPLANHLHTPPSVITTSDTHRHSQAERDSLAGLSEVLTSRAPSLVPNAAGGYDEPSHASEPQPQAPGLTQLRRKLGLPLQRPVHQAAAVPVQHTSAGSAAQQSTEHSDAAVSEPEVERLVSCSYEELTLHDIDLLLKAYRQIAQLKQKQFLKEVYSGALGVISADLGGRFSHYTYGSLRLADVKLVLEDLINEKSARIQGR
ncbi:hypothetical protein ABBQ32_012681 [Trebouxia sp. C0010 RCD-2024]